jgi:flagellar biosynthetic protein FliR
MFGISESQKFLEQYGIHIELFRYLVVGGLIFSRIFILTMFIPYLGTRPIPGRIRMTVSIILTIFFYQPVSLATTMQLPTEGIVLISLFLKEALYGIILGFAAGMVFYGVQAAGNFIDNQRQLANAQIFNPAIGAQSSLFGIFYYQLAIVIFLIMGGHHWLFQALAKSFESMPILTLPKIAPGVTPILETIIRLGADTLVIALQLGAPVVVAIFIADIILGLTNRVAPMVNVFELGFSIKGFLGVLLVYLSLPMILYQMKVWFSQYMDTVLRLVFHLKP